MKGGTLCCALIVLIGVVLGDDESHVPEHFEDFNNIDHRLDELTAHIEHLKDRIHHRTDPDRIRQARSLKVRVQKLEGSGCDDRHFQCGGTDPECQSYLFVCDGHKDCRNGADEEHCELPVKEGDYFEGHVVWDTCTQRKPDVLAFEITSVRTSTIFTPVAMVTANMVIEYEGPLIDGHLSLPTVGAYHFGRHVIAFKPPESDRLAFFCKFDGFNMDRCEGFIAHEASLDVCAELIAVRKRDEQH